MSDPLSPYQPPRLEQANRAGAGPERFGAIGGAIGGFAGGCFGLVYPVVLLTFMLRPSLAAALRDHGSAARRSDKLPI